LSKESIFGGGKVNYLPRYYTNLLELNMDKHSFNINSSIYPALNFN